MLSSESGKFYVEYKRPRSDSLLYFYITGCRSRRKSSTKDGWGGVDVPVKVSVEELGGYGFQEWIPGFLVASPTRL